MAVYTHLTRPVLEAFLARYDLAELVAFTGIAEGIENSNFLLETKNERFILTLFEKRVNPEHLPYFMALKSHLATKTFHCPRPVPDRNGAIVGTLADRPAVIVSFLEGKSVYQPTPTQAHDFGAKLAQMHLSLKDFTLHRENDFSTSCWQRMWYELKPECARLFPEFSHLTETALIATKNWPEPAADMPYGAIHADLFLDNVFFLDQNCSGFIDFYFACSDFWAYDVAVALNAWAFVEHPNGHVAYNRPIGQEILKAYNSRRSFTAAEHIAFPLFMVGAALRFFLTRLADWNATPEGALVQPKNPLPFAQRLSFALAAVNDTKDVYGLPQI